MKKVLTRIICCAFAFVVVSCNSYDGDFIENGTYQSAAFKVRPGHRPDMGEIASSIPTFEFRDNRQVKIYPDFYFGFFTDSIYTYEYFANENILLLEGENIELEIECIYKPGSSRDSYKLINLNSYVETLDITGEEF